MGGTIPWVGDCDLEVQVKSILFSPKLLLVRVVYYSNKKNMEANLKASKLNRGQTKHGHGVNDASLS